MFYITEPSIKNSPWVLSHYKDEKVISIPKDVTKEIKAHHIQAIDFLYRAYKKQFKGVILNEEEGMNMQLQVSAFFRALEPKFLILILSPDRNIVNWHYHLTLHGGLSVQIVTPKTCPEDFDTAQGLALLVSFSNIKLVEYLIDYEYFSVLIDDFDEVASKLIIRKLHGSFNIGLTQKNFYTQPNQKLQWAMLNWCNSGCVGKLGDFYEIDNDNFACFRDNYRHWWFRLTWNYCESFKSISNKEKQEYMKTLSNWAASKHLKNDLKSEKVIKKRKQNEIVGAENSSNSDPQDSVEKITKSAKKQTECVKKNDSDGKNLEKSENSEESNSQSSQDTIIYEPLDMETKRYPNYVELPSMDENPILNSIIRNLEKSPEPILTQHSAFIYTPTKYNIDEPNCSKAFEEEDVLLSIINNEARDDTPMEDETEIDIAKEEIKLQILSEDPCTSKSLGLQEQESQFFQSLIDSDVPVKSKKKRSIVKPRSSDIETILRETEVLLNQ